MKGCSIPSLRLCSFLALMRRAVSEVQELGLQIVLDLHGCPGGESPEVRSASSNGGTYSGPQIETFSKTFFVGIYFSIYLGVYRHYCKFLLHTVHSFTSLHGPTKNRRKAPCGRRQRPESRWDWRHWDFAASLKILQVGCRLYEFFAASLKILLFRPFFLFQFFV